LDLGGAEGKLYKKEKRGLEDVQAGQLYVQEEVGEERELGK